MGLGQGHLEDAPEHDDGPGVLELGEQRTARRRGHVVEREPGQRRLGRTGLQPRAQIGLQPGCAQGCSLARIGLHVLQPGVGRVAARGGCGCSLRVDDDEAGQAERSAGRGADAGVPSGSG